MKPNDTFKCRFGFQVTEQASKPLKYQESKRTAGDSIRKTSLPSEEQATVPKETALMSASSTSFGGAQREFKASKTKLGAQARTAAPK